MLKKLKASARTLKAEAQVLIVAYGDHRTPLFAKILIGITAGYLMSPIDLIPDFIPVLGVIDDLILVPLLITWSIRQIPDIVLTDAREAIKNSSPTMSKRNWIVGTSIILIWIVVLYLINTRWFQ